MPYSKLPNWKELQTHFYFVCVIVRNGPILPLVWGESEFCL